MTRTKVLPSVNGWHQVLLGGVTVGFIGRSHAHGPDLWRPPRWSACWQAVDPNGENRITAASDRQSQWLLVKAAFSEIATPPWALGVRSLSEEQATAVEAWATAREEGASTSELTQVAQRSGLSETDVADVLARENPAWAAYRKADTKALLCGGDPDTLAAALLIPTPPDPPRCIFFGRRT